MSEAGNVDAAVRGERTLLYSPSYSSSYNSPFK
jgi:hypothetical protein